MNATRENNLTHLQRKTQDFSNQLKTDGSFIHYSRELIQLAEDLEKKPQLWYGTDLFHLFSLSTFSDRVYQSARERSSGFIRFLRFSGYGVLLLTVIFCILVTHQISLAFQTAIYINPALEDTPFFTLWLTNFSGILPGVFSFNHVFTIVLILLTVFLALHLTNRQIEKNKSLSARKFAEELTAQFESILWQIQRFLNDESKTYHANAEQRSLAILTAIDKFIVEFETHSKELENIISYEQQRLSNISGQQKIETGRLNSLVEQLHQFSNSFAGSVTQYQQTLAGFQKIVSSLDEESKQFYSIQKAEMELLTDSKVNMENLEKEVGRLTQVQKKITHDLLHATQQNLTKSDELVNSVDNLNSITRQSVEGQINLQNLLDDQMRANDIWVRSVGKSVERMAEVLERLQQFMDTSNIPNNSKSN